MADEGFAAPWLEFEKEFGQRPLLHGPLDKILSGWAAIGGVLVSKYTFPPPDPSVKTEDRSIDGPGGPLKLRIYTPDGYTPGSKPAGLYMHGGGWAIGDLDMEDGDCRRVAKGVGTVVVAVDYRLAPAHKFPAQNEDCFAAYRWVLENAESLGGVQRKVFTIGASAGGGLALGTALRAVDEGLGESLVGVVAQMPVAVHPDAAPEHLRKEYTAYEENAEMTVNTKSAMAAFWDAVGAPPDDKYTSPLLHEKLGSLKRVYITGGTKDTLRDDARLLKRVLDDKRVPNMSDEYEGYPHYFWTFPSKLLDEPRTQYVEKLLKGVDFVLS
ncbi:hypothetical protein H2201_007836 [Coniosporium apollinis]|uniref:Alpha/beta hydrolase fold-3 domain-containing protein n=2 Tax=Coniosporium TaxID=2810619 RepID=A0ABQ9NKJ8_9PEZI|nr:hypothetical protein H2199_007980 [Cladosporium sp. JES 115]KAJ9658277.1 hypothetical protein H2201_007836 [Coniosporium apollinis]